MPCSPPVIVIAGAGAAGMACALSSAMLGAKVVLLEQSGQIGGTVAQALIHTLGGFFDDQGGVLNPGLPEELIERLTRASPLTCKRRIGKTWKLKRRPKTLSTHCRRLDWRVSGNRSLLPHNR